MAQEKGPFSRLIFTREHILTCRGETARLPSAAGLPGNSGGSDSTPPDSTLDIRDPGGSMYRGELYLGPFTPPENFELTHLRAYAHAAGAEQFSFAGRAYQLLFWDATHRYCGQCGERLQGDRPDHSKTCASCGLQIFPQIAPAIIIAVIRDGRLLLGHNVRFPDGLYSLIAGFMEPGETIEECARREVYEETGIFLGKINYFGSQPWPFPHSLMIGLTGEYGGGNISPDGEEITDARWFTPETLPRLPGPGSISRRIIDWYISRYSKHRCGSGGKT